MIFLRISVENKTEHNFNFKAITVNSLRNGRLRVRWCTPKVGSRVSQAHGVVIEKQIADDL